MVKVNSAWDWEKHRPVETGEIVEEKLAVYFAIKKSPTTLSCQVCSECMGLFSSYTKARKAAAQHSILTGHTKLELSSNPQYGRRFFWARTIGETMPWYRWATEDDIKPVKK
jgi:hypothetical protein